MDTTKKIKVLCVDDSPSVLDLLCYILNSDPQIEVIGTALTGKRALTFLENNKPDLICMDLQMPEMDGLEATRIIMETDPVPIIIVSASWSPSEVNDTMKALEAGAITILEKPRGIGHPEHNRMAIELITTVKNLWQVKLVTRRPRLRKSKEGPVLLHPDNKYEKGEIKLVVIGASTGGPPAIHTILSELPKNLNVPVLIVQHIADGFIEGFKKWLAKSTGQKVSVATNRERLLPGQFYLAPNNFQMGVTNSGIINLCDCDPASFICPSASYLFKSVAENYGKNAIGVLLTGMGTDGAVELKMMKDKGAVTIAQDEASSVIYGMPGEAHKIGAAKYDLPPAAIAQIIAQLLE
jgi:two-component system chemotaxis response regulator CheB